MSAVTLTAVTLNRASAVTAGEGGRSCVPEELPLDALSTVDKQKVIPTAVVLNVNTLNCIRSAVPSADEVKTNERERTEMIIKALSRVTIKYKFVMPRGKPVVDDFKNSITVGCEMPRYAPLRSCDLCCAGAFSINCPDHMMKCGREIFLECSDCSRVLCYDHRLCFCGKVMAAVHSCPFPGMDHWGMHASNGR